MPGTTPATASAADRRITIERMSADSAPSAMRTPISCVRCDTANDSRP